MSLLLDGEALEALEQGATLVSWKEFEGTVYLLLRSSADQLRQGAERFIYYQQPGEHPFRYVEGYNGSRQAAVKQFLGYYHRTMYEAYVGETMPDPDRRMKKYQYDNMVALGIVSV